MGAWAIESKTFLPEQRQGLTPVLGFLFVVHEQRRGYAVAHRCA